MITCHVKYVIDPYQLADYEAYRQRALSDPDSVALVASVMEKKFILSYERSFLRPLLS